MVDHIISLNDRAMGVLAGVAIGDALGMPTEFLSPTKIRDWYGEIRSLVAPHPSHPHHRLPAGSVTDDTGHTLLLGDLLLAHGQIEPKRLAESLLAWSQTPRVQQNRFVGPSTLRSLAALQAGESLDQAPRGGTTVGGAMRVAALAIVFPELDRLAEQVVASCAITHFTHNAISGAMSMAFALSAALTAAPTDSASLDSLVQAAQKGAILGRTFGNWSWSPPIEERIAYVAQWVRTEPEEEVLARLRILIGTDLTPEQLVPAAIGLALLAQGEPQKAMIWAANMGGDTDTLASMTGSICGGLTGIEGFNPDMLAQVEAVNRLDLRATANSLVTMRSALPLPLNSARF